MELTQNTVHAVLAAGSAVLTQSEHARPYSNAKRDAEILLAHVLQVSRTYLYTHPLHTLTHKDKEQFNILLNRRIQGEPIAYILGNKEFWSLNLEISDAVLIPRPETEVLVEAVLERLPKDAPIRVLDLGTGSGAIALALAVECPLWEITAIERSQAALKVAQKNAKRLAVENVKFYESDWFTCLAEMAATEKKFDVIVSNPPYISPKDPHLLQGDVRYEPETALVAAENGFADLNHIVQESRHYLVSKGWLFLEHGMHQGPILTGLLQSFGFIDIQDIRDLSDVGRVVIARTR